MLFQALWRHNDDNLPIGIHHGSLATEQRRKVEAHMAEGGLRAVVATSSLDLGSIGLISIWLFRSVHRRERRGCCNGSVVPAIGMI